LTSIGVKLREIRQQHQLPLREVEERSLCLAREWGNQSYQISASWLVRLEREEHDLTAKKLIALAMIYAVPPEELLRCLELEDAQVPTVKQLSIPNATLLLTEGSRRNDAQCFLPEGYFLDQQPEETRLLGTEGGQSKAVNLRGIIGERDRTLDPMIPAGSMVYIDTRSRAIPSRNGWRHEFQRPICFLMTRDAYFCGWCELDKGSEWLTLEPHPLSAAPVRRWRYRKEVEVIGRVIRATIPLG
jgi:transcriptional regulator with XRE-family HTH domain